MCIDRGVFFTYVDLRWGITTEQSSDGKTIAICLQEVKYHTVIIGSNRDGYILFNFFFLRYSALVIFAIFINFLQEVIPYS